MTVERGFSRAQDDPKGSRYMLTVNDKGEFILSNYSQESNKTNPLSLDGRGLG
ncbi:MAG: hypothetical protein J7L90_02720 [Dehalococcoidia bacterium]|nr:hypothetical protein [Dehalococcoidia bacterium]